MHEHEHRGHEHPHEHSHTQAVSNEERLALLEYMLGHNRHHAEELNDLAAGLPKEKAELIYAAVEDFQRGNEKIAQVLSALKPSVST